MQSQDQELGDRMAECDDQDAYEVRKIEVEFGMLVYMSQEQQARLMDLLNEIVNAPCNQLKEGVHWIFGYGSKPKWSRSDAQFLGLPADPQAPETGEPEFDNSTFHVESMARAFISDYERERTLRERDNK